MGSVSLGGIRFDPAVVSTLHFRPSANLPLSCSVHNAYDRLYENYPNGQEDLLLDMMQKLKSTGSPWEDIFAETVSPWSIRPTV